MATFKAPRIDITVNDITLTGYKTESGQWVMSLSSMARVLDLQATSAFDFLQSKWLKSKLGGSFPPSTFSVNTEDNTQPIVAISTEIAAKFFQFKYVKADNPIAEKLVDALMQQALDLRFEGNLDPTAQYQEIEKIVGVKEGRKQTRATHPGFVNWYRSCGYSGYQCHEYLTKQVANLTAQEARLLPVYSGSNEEIGLDHYQESHNREMVNIGRVKDTLAQQAYRPSETYQQAINRAIVITELV